MIEDWKAKHKFIGWRKCTNTLENFKKSENQESEKYWHQKSMKEYIKECTGGGPEEIPLGRKTKQSSTEEGVKDIVALFACLFSFVFSLEWKSRPQIIETVTQQDS